jgi:hypothetical protein
MTLAKLYDINKTFLIKFIISFLIIILFWKNFLFTLYNMSNIIVNGDFLNNYNNWTKTGLFYGIRVGEGAVSGNSLYMGAGFGDQPDIIYQNITLIPGLTYALRFYYKTESSPPSNALLKISILGINTDLPPVLSYTLYETTFVANNANAVLTFTSQNANAANFLSNISVVPRIAPSILLLFVL